MLRNERKITLACDVTKDKITQYSPMQPYTALNDTINDVIGGEEIIGIMGGVE